MDRDAFIADLVNSGLTKKASTARASWANRIESTYGTDLDKIVRSKSDTLDLVERIYDGKQFTARQRANFPNAVRKYYQFINGEQLGTLRENNR